MGTVVSTGLSLALHRPSSGHNGQYRPLTGSPPAIQWARWPVQASHWLSTGHPLGTVAGTGLSLALHRPSSGHGGQYRPLTDSPPAIQWARWPVQASHWLSTGHPVGTVASTGLSLALQRPYSGHGGQYRPLTGSPPAIQWARWSVQASHWLSTGHPVGTVASTGLSLALHRSSSGNGGQYRPLTGSPPAIQWARWSVQASHWLSTGHPVGTVVSTGLSLALHRPSSGHGCQYRPLTGSPPAIQWARWSVQASHWLSNGHPVGTVVSTGLSLALHRPSSGHGGQYRPLTGSPPAIQWARWSVQACHWLSTGHPVGTVASTCLSLALHRLSSKHGGQYRPLTGSPPAIQWARWSVQASHWLSTGHPVGTMASTGLSLALHRPSSGHGGQYRPLTGSPPVIQWARWPVQASIGSPPAIQWARWSVQASHWLSTGHPVGTVVSTGLSPALHRPSSGHGGQYRPLTGSPPVIQWARWPVQASIGSPPAIQWARWSVQASHWLSTGHPVGTVVSTGLSPALHRPSSGHVGQYRPLTGSPPAIQWAWWSVQASHWLSTGHPVGTVVSTGLSLALHRPSSGHNGQYRPLTGSPPAIQWARWSVQASHWLSTGHPLGTVASTGLSLALHRPSSGHGGQYRPLTVSPPAIQWARWSVPFTINDFTMSQ